MKDAEPRVILTVLAVMLGLGLAWAGSSANFTTLAPGTLQFSAATTSVAENAGSIILGVTRAGGSDGTASVHYATADGTALAGSDYIAASGTLDWLDGDATNKTITVDILDNNVYEGDRTFSVSLNNPGGAVLGASATAMVTIAENEAPPNPPTGVSASDGDYVDRIRVTWSPVTNASYYEIWRGTNLDQLTLIKHQFILAGTKIDDTNAEALVTYYYRLKSSNNVGSGSFSAADTGWRRVNATRLAADFDGDRLADPAAYVSGDWYVWLSIAGYQRVGPVALGSAGATPVAADFDGDRLADPAVYDGTNWTEWLSGSDYAAAGPYPYSVSGMSALAVDFDEDGKADPTGWVLGEWYVWLSSLGYDRLGPIPLGAAMAAPIAADLDGDGIGDVAVYSPMNWSEWRSGSVYAESGPYPYGVGGGIPLAADFDGDGLADPAAVVTNDWTVWLSTAGYTKFGPYSLPVTP
ncbi:MAG: hypothetical protein HYV35_02625 [Lentisphaerae bacterium]|nr:hypothetical protein [Lentisphaerota bacterium]